MLLVFIHKFKHPDSHLSFTPQNSTPRIVLEILKILLFFVTAYRP